MQSTMPAPHMTPFELCFLQTTMISHTQGRKNDSFWLKHSATRICMVFIQTVVYSLTIYANHCIHMEESVPKSTYGQIHMEESVPKSTYGKHTLN
jgi:hypothetical protein